MNFFTSVGNEPVSQLIGSFQEILDYHLHCAVISENIALASELKNKGAHIDGRDVKGNTRLISCASKGQVRWMRLLQEAGANVNAQNSGGATALSFLLREPRTIVHALELLRRGADANIPDVQGFTPFRSLIETNHMMSAWRFHSFCKVDMGDRFGNTPFMQMIEIRDTRRAGQLLKMRANINAQNHQHQTALSKELERQDKSFLIIEKMLANLNDQNHQYQTALSKELQIQKKSFIIEKMLANLNAQNHQHQATLSTELERQKQSFLMVTWLFQKGAHSNQEREFISKDSCGKRKGVKEPHSLFKATLKEKEHPRLKEGYEKSRFLLKNRELPFSIVDKIVSFLENASTLSTLQLVNSKVWKEFSLCVKSIHLPLNFSIKNPFDSFLIDTMNLTQLSMESLPDTHLCFFLNALPALRTLELSCPVGECCVYFLSQLTSLQNLNLSYCKYVSDNTLYFLSHLTTLTSLSFEACEAITDRGLNFLNPLNHLEALNLSGLPQITDHGLNNAVFWTALKTLNLNHCQITDHGLSQLSACLLLETLSLSACKITDFSALSSLTNLKHLALWECDSVTDTTLYSLRNFISLRAFTFYGKNITDEGISYLSCLTSLENLDLLNCDLMPSKILCTLKTLTLLKNLALRMPGYHSLFLSSLGGLKGFRNSCAEAWDTKSLNDLRHLTSLQSLHWHHANDAFLGAVKKLTSLTSLELFNCENVTGVGLENLSNLNLLEKLKISDMNPTLEVAQNNLRRHLPSLRV